LGARCETKKGNGDNVPCNCKATACDNNKNFELGSNGLCVKRAAEEKEESELTTLDVSVNGTGYGYYDIDGDYKEESNCSVSTAGEWCAVFPKYMVKGKAVCNSTTGTYAVAISSEQRQLGGERCWCKMIKPKESSWVYVGWYDDSAKCANSCAYGCAKFVTNHIDFRRSVFGSAK